MVKFKESWSIVYIQKGNTLKPNKLIKRIINIYRSFNPNGLTQREQFLIQCEKISLACNKDTIIIGDTNLDYNRRDDVNYQYGQLFEVFNDKLSRFNLLQLVNFDTWFRTVGAVNRSSCLDHIYVPDVISVTNITHETPMFGDHQLVMANLCVVRPQPQIKSDRVVTFIATKITVHYTSPFILYYFRK